MITTLENLTEKVKENNLKNLAKNIVKYQNFKTSVVLNKIDTLGFTRSTIKTYIDCGINFVRKGIKYPHVNKSLYLYIEECLKEHMQPLTPTFEEKRVILKQSVKKETVLPVQNVLEKLQKQSVSELQTKFYGIQLENRIILQDTKEEANAFYNGLVFMGNNNAKIVKVKIEEI